MICTFLGGKTRKTEYKEYQFGTLCRVSGSFTECAVRGRGMKFLQEVVGRGYPVMEFYIGTELILEIPTTSCKNSFHYL